MVLKLYLISQTVNDDWDTYDSAVVIAESVEEARNVNPRAGLFNTPLLMNWENNSSTSWCQRPEDVSVEYLGEAAEGLEKGVVCSSFNAG